MVIFSDTLSACDTCTINKSTQQKHPKISRPDPSSERLKLVSTDLLGPGTPKAIEGYAYMAKYTDHHSRLREASFIEEPSSVLLTADSATSHVRVRQPALQCQYSPKQQFEVVSEYTMAVGIDKINPPASISVPNTYAQPMASPQAYECKPSATSARRSKTSARTTPSKLQHLKVATAAPARKTAFHHRNCLVNCLSQPP